VLLAAVVYAASGLVGHIPLVALAGVLLVTSWRMVERHTVRAVLTSTRGDALVFVVTAVATVALDLVTAVAVGMALAVLVAVARMAATAQVVPEVIPVEVDGEQEHALLSDHVLTYRLDGPLFFAAAARFLAEISVAADVRVVILRLSALDLLDATGARALGEVVEDLEQRGITVLVKGASAEHLRLLAAVGTLRPLVDRKHVFPDLPSAVAHALEHVAVPAVR
jgi:sulfate permease, SulP family